MSAGFSDFPQDKKIKPIIAMSRIGLLSID
jgi:hypothetical protein